MATKKCSGQITITDLNDGKILSTYTSASLGFTQMMDSDTGKYDNDYSASGKANVLTAQLYVSGESGNQAESCSSWKWYVNNVEVTSNNTTGFKVSTNTLTISKNLDSSTTAYNVRWEAVYADTTIGSSLSVTDSTSIVYVKSGSTSPQVYVEYPVSGYTFNGDVTSIQIRAYLKRGSKIDKDNLTVTWYKLTVVNGAASWTKVTGAVWDSTNGYSVLTQSRDDVDGQESYKVEFTDTVLKDGTFTGYASLIDKLDEWRCEVVGTKVIKKGMSDVTITAVVYKNNQPLSDFSGLTFNWYKKDRSGSGVNWSGTTSSVKSTTGGNGTGNTLKVLSTDINTQTDILCEVLG